MLPSQWIGNTTRARNSALQREKIPDKYLAIGENTEDFNCIQEIQKRLNEVCPKIAEQSDKLEISKSRYPYFLVFG